MKNGEQSLQYKKTHHSMFSLPNPGAIFVFFQVLDKKDTTSCSLESWPLQLTFTKYNKKIIFL